MCLLHVAMVLHLLALVKLKLLATASQSAFNPLFPCLAYPFVLKLCMCLRCDLRGFHATTAQSLRFFLYRLGCIIFRPRQEEEDLGDAGRWRRVLRLVQEIINRATTVVDSRVPSDYEDILVVVRL